MASESPPPGSGDAKQPAQASASPQAPFAAEAQETGEPLKNVSPKSVFVNAEPIREDQVENAVKFLSHPKVKDSPVVHRRNFLERKGLTKEEIDEAFRRVPDSSPNVTGAQTSTSNQDGTVRALPNSQQQSSAQVLQPAEAAKSGVLSTLPRRFQWQYAFLAIGFVAASGAGSVILFKKSIVPWLRSWIRGVVSDDGHDSGKTNAPSSPSLSEEAIAAAKSAAAAAVDAAKASQEMVFMKAEERKWSEKLMNLLDAQLQEIKSVKTAMEKLEGQNRYSGRSHHLQDEYLNGSISRQLMDNGKAELDSRSARSSSPPSTSEPPHPKSYMEIMAMIQRGEQPPNIREINDAPPNPNQPIPNPSLAPRTKPWESVKPASTTNFGSQSPFTNEGASSVLQAAYRINNEPSPPSWKQKNVRITEIENEDGDLRSGSSSVGQAPERKWVPPRPPPVAMAEAAVAIRQPKSIPKDRSLDSTSSNGSEIDELQRVTNMAESGGEKEKDMNGPLPTEIQEE